MNVLDNGCSFVLVKSEDVSGLIHLHFNYIIKKEIKIKVTNKQTNNGFF